MVYMPKVTIDLTNLPYVTNDCYYQLYENKSRYLVLMGGGSSGKSYFAAQKMIYRMLTETGQRFLICRKVGDTLRDSVFAELRDSIYNLGLEELFIIPKGRSSELYIKCKNGNEILFYGLDNVEKRKSIKGITSIWIEEASELDAQDFRQLDIRLRDKAVTYQQIILSFNPISITHWLKGEFFDNKKPDSKVLRTTYKDNRFLTQNAIDVLEGFKQTDLYYYTVYCLGEWGVLGRIVFDAEKVSTRLSQVRTIPKQVGRLENKNGKMEFIEDVNGYLTIYTQPQKNKPYIIGADVAEGLEYGDYDAAHVLDNITLEQAAVFHGHLDVDMFADELNKLGKYYNNALLTPEVNFNPGIILNLEKMNYPKLYMREQMDNITHQIQKKFGWKTTKINRVAIISNLIELVRDYPHLINDAKTLEEMLSFVRDEKGRMQAMDNAHDDLVMSLAIALEAGMSGQQTKATVTKQIDQAKVNKLPEDAREDYYSASAEQREYLAKKWDLYAT